MNDPVADQREPFRLEKIILERCRAGNLVVRMAHELASEKSALATGKLTELDQRFALLISRLTSATNTASYPRELLLGILTRVDQAEAFANEIVAADGGANIDTLAERLAKLVELIGSSATEILECQRNRNMGD